jgi:hypothetical protein
MRIDAGTCAAATNTHPRQPQIHHLPATQHPTRTTHHTAGCSQELPLQGDDALGTADLAFHARLIELALQAENAAGPLMHEDRKRGRAANAQGPEAWEDRKRAAKNANAPSPPKLVNA